MIIYDKIIPVKNYKQKFDELETFCKHNQDVEILLKEWIPLEVVLHMRHKYGSEIKCPHIGQVLTEIFVKLIDEAAYRKRSKTKTPNPSISNDTYRRTLMALEGFLGNDPLRTIVSGMFCLLRYYSGEKDITT